MAKAQELIAELQGRESRTAEPGACHHPGRDQPHRWRSSGSSGGRRQASTTSPSTRSTRATFILTAALGNFQTFQWRNHSGFDLDNQYIWWHSSSAAPAGELALNFGRIEDPRIDELLDPNRAETDPAKKQEYAEEVNRTSARSATTSGPAGTSGASPTSPPSTAWRTSPSPTARPAISVRGSWGPSIPGPCGSSSDRSACLKGEATRRGREATACSATSANG